jgi:hypothetical protein
MPELLPEQHLDIRLIVNHENEKVHARSPDLTRAAPVRGLTDPRLYAPVPPAVPRTIPAVLWICRTEP